MNSKRIDLFNLVKVRVNINGYNYLKNRFGKEIVQEIDEDGFIIVQMYDFFNLFSNFVEGFDYFKYSFDKLDGNKDVEVIFDQNTDLDITLTELGMIELYDLELDGVFDDPSKKTNLSVDMLISTIGKYFHADREFPIERSIYIKDNHFSKVKMFKK